MFVLYQDAEGKVSALERKLAELKGDEKPVGPTLKALILTLCNEEVGPGTNLHTLTCTP